MHEVLSIESAEVDEYGPFNTYVNGSNIWCLHSCSKYEFSLLAADFVYVFEVYGLFLGADSFFESVLAITFLVAMIMYATNLQHCI